MDLKLNKTTHDLELTNNSFTLVDGAEAINQHWLIRMGTWDGDWFLDTRIGIPYLKYVLIKNPNMTILKSVFYEASLQTPGIREIASFDLELSPDRLLTVSIEGETEDLETFKFVYEEMILSQRGAATA